MLEIMQGNLGGVRPTYPNSGPGIKVLTYGDENIGYFGEVTSSELFTAAEFASKANAYFGTRDTAADTITQLWLKFFFKGKVLFIAKIPFNYAVMWEDVYKAGLMYGTQDNGKYPVTNAATWQYNPISKVETGGKEWVFIPRTIKAVSSDPWSTLDNNAYLGSEWTELLGRVSVSTNTPVDEKWANFTLTQLGMDTGGGARYPMGQETQASNIANAIYTGTGAAGGFFTRTAANKQTANLSWRPVLVLQNPADGVVPADSISTDSLGLPQIYMANLNPATQLETAFVPEDVYVANFPTKEILPTFSNDASSALRATDVQSNEDTATWGSFTITGAYTT